ERKNGLGKASRLFDQENSNHENDHRRDDTATTYHIASQPSDHLTIHNPTVMISTKNDNDFLRTCSLCNQNLCHRRDIYMYRYVFMFLNQPFEGDNAFCSLECRGKQIKLDERKVNNGVASNKPIRI
ncbi:hypothetical protein DY000_02005781, partial [Brassica cretica]